MAKPKAFKLLQDKEEFVDKAIVPCIRGKIIAIYAPNKGQGENGPYSYQNADMEDEEGTKMRVTFANNEQDMSVKGRMVTITSQPSAQHGLQGIKIEDTTYVPQGKTEKVHKRILRITGTAKVEYDGGAPAKSGQTDGTGASSASPGLARSNVSVKQALTDMLDCHQAVTLLVNERYADASEAFRQGSVNTIFIECTKAGIVADFKKRYEKKEYPPVPSDPSKWKECILPKGQYEGKSLADVPDDDLLKMYSLFVDAGATSNTAKCVAKAVEDRDLLPKPEPEERPPEDKALDPDQEDDIPF